ncbi:MAG: DUF1499 domain-containing protein [Vicinamibacterales bacterium]
MLFLASCLVVAGLVLLGLGPLGTRIGLWGFTIGLPVVGLGALVTMAGVLVAFGGGIRSRDWNQAGFALVVGLIAVAIPIAQVLKGRGAPSIHDISTDTQDPPLFQALLPLRTGRVSPAAYDGDATAAQQRASYGDIESVLLPAAPGQAFALSLRAARDLGWTIVDSDEAAGRIEATDTTYWFGFVDDVVIRVRAEGGVSRVDIRSKSRVGRGDLGANARRIRAFISRVNES